MTTANVALPSTSGASPARRLTIDGGLQCSPADRGSAIRAARSGAAAGYDRLFSAEAAHDPFLPLALAAREADLDLGTYIAVAFARNPMTTAQVSRDLQMLTGGRFILGLGSQIKAHVTRRFSMPWSHPAPRMREFVLALHAIWDHWEQETPLDFDGEFYQHTLSNPLFHPGSCGLPSPRVFLAAVGPHMTEVAGEVADGLLCHGFTSPSYLAEVTLPALRRGLTKSGRRPEEVEICLPPFLATGPAGSDLEPKVAALRRQLAFYGSTPAYLGVLEHHGWGDLHSELHALSRDDRWEEMGKLIDDDVLNTLGVVADSDHLAAALVERYGETVDGLRLNVPYLEQPEVWTPVISALKRPQP